MDREVASVAVALGTAAREAVLGVGPNRFDAEALGDVALQGTDGDGCVDRAAAAGVFAGRGADPAADRSEWIRGAGDEVGLLLATLGDELHVAAGVGGHRAARLALDLCLPVFEVGKPGGYWTFGCRTCGRGSPPREAAGYDRCHEAATFSLGRSHDGRHSADGEPRDPWIVQEERDDDEARQR